jgi:hypothetical protein
MARRALRLWLIDDSSEPHAVAAETVARLGGVDLSHFHSGSEALETFAALAAQAPGDLPEVVLMDFYLGASERGDRITAELRRLEPPGSAVTIVGYSSVLAGSQSILAAGGDAIVPKLRASDGTNPSLSRFLRDCRRVRRGESTSSGA